MGIFPWHTTCKRNIHNLVLTRIFIPKSLRMVTMVIDCSLSLTGCAAVYKLPRPTDGATLAPLVSKSALETTVPTMHHTGQYHMDRA